MITAKIYDPQWNFIRWKEGFSVDGILFELEGDGFKGHVVIQSDLPAGTPKNYEFK